MTRVEGHRPAISQPPRRGTRAGRRNRRGAALVEFAVVSPLLFMLLFAVFEFGRVMMVEQVLTNAAREGARRGILEQTTASEVQTIVTDYLAGSSISGAAVTVAPPQLEKIGFGDPVTVTVSVPFSQVSWLPAPWFLGGADLSIQCVMLGERPE